MELWWGGTDGNISFVNIDVKIWLIGKIDGRLTSFEVQHLAFFGEYFIPPM